MLKSSIKLVTLTVFFAAMVATPTAMPAFAAGGGDPGSADNMRPSAPPLPPTKAPSNARSSQKSKKAAKQSFLTDPAFIGGYHEAYISIYERHDFAAAIDKLKALGHDDDANVANLIGYSYRKLGDYRLSQVWYERALTSDPNHVLTWNYYGLWQIEQGNREQAEYHLQKIAQLAGTTSAEYRSLAAALEQPPGTGLVY